jgi:hypothetical protein
LRLTVKGVPNGLAGTLDVRLEDDRKLLVFVGGAPSEELLEGEPRRRRHRLTALLVFAMIDDALRDPLAFDHMKVYSGLRHIRHSDELDRNRGPGCLDTLPLVVLHRADPTPLGLANDDVADLERALLHEHRRDRAPPLAEACFDDHAAGPQAGIGSQLEHFGLQCEHLEQFVEPMPRLCGNVYEDRLATEVLGNQLVLHQALSDLRRVGTR